MSFVIQRTSGRGWALAQVRGSVLRIGRGANAELRSENPAVSLEHAVIEEDANGFIITDRGSITGTYVNHRPVETARLAQNDVIEIGDLRIEVQVIESGKPLFVRVSSTTASGPIIGDGDEEESGSPIATGVRGGSLKAPKIDYVSAYKLRRGWLTNRSLIAIALIAAFLIVAEIAKPEKQSVFMPGGVSSAHSRAIAKGKPIASNCAACHDPWRGVSDSGCIECHKKLREEVVWPHAENQIGAPACADCHPEHRGVAKLAAAADATCVSCHSNIAEHVANRNLLSARPREVLSITSFDKHPEFTPRSDPDTLRFNHALHLKAGGIFNGGGRREELQCVTCHKLVETKGKIDPAPVAFKNDCQRCHKLTFDARFPDTEVPHGGDSGIVYGFVLATYAGNRDIAGKSPEEIRRILTSRPPVAPDERAIINVEQVIKTKCSKCHTLEQPGRRITVKPPEIPARWFFTARFTHTPPHDKDCESCHTTARLSTKTSDVLMPSRKDCTGCHGAQSSRTSSSCVTCHGYHEHSKILHIQIAPPGRRMPAAASMFGGESGMMETVLSWAIVLLLLVVLVPVGLAFYKRFRVGTEDGPAVRSASALSRSERIPAPEPPYKPDPPTRPDAPLASPDDKTRTVSLPPQKPPNGGTETMPWYGYLICTSGLLEGKYFIIEPDGFWIGRPTPDSPVVIAGKQIPRIEIADKRVSKEHLRIVVRDGKVMAIDQKNSTNGTFLGKAGGERISEVQLKQDDVLVLADNAATFLYKV